MTRTEPGARRAARALIALGVVIPVIAGCAALPTSGAPQVVRKVADQSDASQPQGPAAGQQPEQIVREFIHALAMTDYDTAGESYVVAQQYLTDAARRRWAADASATPIIVLADDFSATPDPEHPEVVVLSGRQVGVVNEDRSYRAVDSREYRVAVPLTRADDQWRISEPPATIVITQSDFATALRQRTVYFLDSSGRVVVPDIRYIPNSHTPDLSANRLMDLLLRGPSDALAGAARTALGKDAQLQSNVHIDAAGVAHVDLEGVDVSTPAARQAVVAQIVWTLDPDVGQIAITVNGLPLDGPPLDATAPAETSPAGNQPAESTVFSLSSGTVATFDPDAVPGSAQAVSDAYYIDGGAVLRLADGAPMWGSVGTGSVHVTSAALSAASGAMAAVARDPDGGAQLLVGRPFDHQPAVTVLKATTLTQPSFTRWGYAAWTVQNGATQPEVYQVSISAGTPTWSRVSAPQLAGIGPVTALALSPDGVRVALVAGGTLYLGAIGSSPEPAADPVAGGAEDADRHGPQLINLRVLRADLTDVGPVTWDDSTSLLVGAKVAGSRHRTVFEVSIDGQSADPVTTSQVLGDVFGDVEAIASAGPDQPILISFGGRIWQLQGSKVTGRWMPPDGRNWMTGTMPFYPH